MAKQDVVVENPSIENFAQRGLSKPANGSETIDVAQNQAAVDATGAVASAGLFSRSGLFSNKALFIFVLSAAAGFVAYKFRKEIKSYFYKPVVETRKRLHLAPSDVQEDKQTAEKMTSKGESAPGIEDTQAETRETMELSNPSQDSNESSQEKAPLTLEEFEHLADEVDRDIGFDENEQKALDTSIARQRAQEAAATTFNLDEAPGSITLIQTSVEDVMPLRGGSSRIEEMTSEQLSAHGTEEHILHDDDANTLGNAKRRRRR